MHHIIMALLLAAAPRNQQARTEFVRANPCPKTCNTYVRTGSKFTLYEKCGACEVDHKCPLACGGPDAVENMEWMDKKANRKKGADCSSCRL